MSFTAQLEELIHEHTPQQVRARLAENTHSGYLPDAVYGAIDGTVTTFAVVSGVAGAALSSDIVIILGFANLIGDGFSMAASNYLGVRTEQQLNEKARQSESDQIDAYPEGEREEVRQIFSRKGFKGDDLTRAVEIITSDRQRWIETMMTDELGLSLSERSPLKAAGATMIAFLLIGFIPLLAFVVQAVWPAWMTSSYAWSCLLTAFAFFSVGAIKSRFVKQHWTWSGLETLALGGAAALLAYSVGVMLRGIAA